MECETVAACDPERAPESGDGHDPVALAEALRGALEAGGHRVGGIHTTMGHLEVEISVELLDERQPRWLWFRIDEGAWATALPELVRGLVEGAVG